MNDNDTVLEAYFQCGWNGPKRSGRFNGLTVKEVVNEVMQYAARNKIRDDVFIAVRVRRPDGIIARYSAKVAPGETRATWELSG